MVLSIIAIFGFIIIRILRKYSVQRRIDFVSLISLPPYPVSSTSYNHLVISIQDIIFTSTLFLLQPTPSTRKKSTRVCLLFVFPQLIFHNICSLSLLS